MLRDDDCNYLIDYNITNFCLSLNKILEMCTPILGININLTVTERREVRKGRRRK